MTPREKRVLQQLANQMETAAREGDWSVVKKGLVREFNLDIEQHWYREEGARSEAEGDQPTHQSNNGGANGVSDPNKYLNKDSYEAYPELDAIEEYLDDERGR